MTDDLDEFGSDEFFDAEMTGIEQKHDLERAVRAGQDVELAIAEGGPLASYMVERRRLGLDALAGLVEINPADAVAIATLQATVREYLNVRTWVRRTVATAQDAKEMLRDEFGDEEKGRGQDHVED